MLVLLLCLQRRGGTAAEDSDGTGDAAGLMAQACTFKDKTVHPQRCSGLRHCGAWNGQYGPQSDVYDCSRAEAEAVASVQGLFTGIDSTEVHTACWEALMTLHCARVFAAAAVLPYDQQGVIFVTGGRNSTSPCKYKTVCLLSLTLLGVRRVHRL